MVVPDSAGNVICWNCEVCWKCDICWRCVVMCSQSFATLLPSTPGFEWGGMLVGTLVYPPGLCGFLAVCLD